VIPRKIVAHVVGGHSRTLAQLNVRHRASCPTALIDLGLLTVTEKLVA
jgi:hypothetical protein